MRESIFPPPPVPTVGSLVTLAQQQTAAEFERSFGRAVLVGPPGEGEGRAEDDPWAFNTVSFGSVTDKTPEQMDSFRESLVFGVKKAGPGAFADTILIGRSSSNDICIADASLSKLHARIHLRDDDSMVITDSGSKNGTTVNGRLLGKKDEAKLRHGDEVQFGTRTFKVYATSRLHSVLAKLVPS